VKYLLDTCVLSELVRSRPDAQVIDWLRRQDSESLYISIVTIGEIEKGIIKRVQDERAAALRKWLHTEILGEFSDRILPVDLRVALEWGRICGEAERIGKKRPAVDALIAATASVNSLKLVTRNISDMTGMGVPVLNPFTEA
jgi:predicted nucleic acid-binding protein